MFLNLTSLYLVIKTFATAYRGRGYCHYYIIYKIGFDYVIHSDAYIFLQKKPIFAKF
uniref:Uncharacterized protein n=1 Tax=Glycine max TaxID=3847 RepID=C6TLG7_SOYBN|nr:unknown [Glycine max]